MLHGKSYDNKIDIWALGILLYELVHGDAPYGEDTPIAEKMDYIKNNKQFNYNESLSVELVDLIQSILQPNPDKRMTMQEIFNHTWMKGFEKSYGIDIKSFLIQNSADANSVMSESTSNAGAGSERSLYSTISTSDARQQKEQKDDLGRSLFKEKDTINYAEPDGKLITSFFEELNLIIFLNIKRD